MVDHEGRSVDLELDWDEAEHVTSVPQDVGDRIALTRAAAVLTLNGMEVADGPLPINDPKGLASLMLAKSAQDLRFATIGMSLGHYSGVFAVLRAALESLSFANLFDSDPGQVGRWLKNALSSGPRDPQADADLLRDARTALIEGENDPKAIRRGVKELVDHANKHIHSTVQGLAHQFDIEVEDLMPDQLSQLLGTEGISVEYALSLYELSQKHEIKGLPREPEEPGDKELIPIQFGVRYDGETLDDLALFAFYISHRSLDLMKSVLEISDPEFNRNYDRWHADLANT